jgi:hypothetical protein
MARIDKTASDVGVVRADLEADIPADHLDKVYGVGINALGHQVFGAGQSGIIGVANPSKFHSKAGRPADIFVLGDAVDCVGLSAGRKAYADNTTGVITTPEAAPAAADATYVGFTVEADRLVIRL